MAPRAPSLEPPLPTPPPKIIGMVLCPRPWIFGYLSQGDLGGRSYDGCALPLCAAGWRNGSCTHRPRTASRQGLGPENNITLYVYNSRRRRRRSRRYPDFNGRVLRDVYLCGSGGRDGSCTTHSHVYRRDSILW